MSGSIELDGEDYSDLMAELAAAKAELASRYKLIKDLAEALKREHNAPYPDECACHACLILARPDVQEALKK